MRRPLSLGNINSVLPTLTTTKDNHHEQWNQTPLNKAHLTTKDKFAGSNTDHN